MRRAAFATFRIRTSRRRTSKRSSTTSRRSIGWSTTSTKRQKPIADDPVLGAIGGSYGGGYQTITALTELSETGRTRFDALAPEITWYDLPEALAPQGVVRNGLEHSSVRRLQGSREQDARVHRPGLRLRRCDGAVARRNRAGRSEPRSDLPRSQPCGIRRGRHQARHARSRSSGHHRQPLQSEPGPSHLRRCRDR